MTEYQGAKGIQQVLVQNPATGEIHRRGLIEGIPGLMSYERCNRAHQEDEVVIADISGVTDYTQLCGHCFRLQDFPSEDAPHA